MDKHFFDTVRPLFMGRMTQRQVDGMNRIVEYGKRLGVSRVHLAYILATVYHETARWMEPIREGARRYGPDYTDAQSRRAVAVIHAKGIIRYNYALPDANGNSFYGRGLVQITHKENYAKYGIENDPDKALEWPMALYILFRGMLDGDFTGVSLADVTEVGEQDYSNDRVVVNGDTKKNGKKIAQDANYFYAALENYTPAEPEKTDGSSTVEGAWPPRWWPFPTD